MSIQLKVHHKDGAVKVVDIPTGNKSAVLFQQPNHPVTYELFDTQANKGPQRVFSKRQGANLELFLDGDNTADLIILDYYNNPELSPVVGLSENGSFYAYIAESGLEADAIPLLKDGVLASEVLGGEAFPLALLPFNWTPFLYGLGGVLGAGILAAAFKGGNGGGNGGSNNNRTPSEPETPPTPETPKAPKPQLTQTKDANGKLTGGLEMPLDPAVDSYDVKFTQEGSTKPTTIRVTKDSNGNFVLNQDDLNKAFPNKTPEEIKNLIKIEDGKLVLGKDALKDNADVTVVAHQAGSDATETTITAPYENNQKPLVVEKVVNAKDEKGEDGNVDNADLVVTGEPGATVTAYDANGKKVGETKLDKNGNGLLHVSLDPKDPKADSLDDIKLVSTKENHNPEETTIPAEKMPAASDISSPNAVIVEKPMVTAESKPKNPEQPEGPKNIEYNVELADKANTKEVVVKITDPADGSTKEFKVAKDENGKFKLPADAAPTISNLVETDTGFTLTLDGEQIAPDAKITAKTVNNLGKESPETDPVIVDSSDNVKVADPENFPQATKPTITESSIKSIDLNTESDKTVEKIRFSGTADAGDTIEVYVVKEGKEILFSNTTKADASGNFSVEVGEPNGVDLEAGDTIIVKASASGKKPSEASNSVAIPELNNDPASHPNDTIKPEAPVVDTNKTQGSEKQAGDGSATVRADKINPNEILEITVTAEDGTEKTLKFTADKDGKLVVDPANDPEMKATVDPTGKAVTIPEESIQDNTPVKAVVQDPAGRTSSVTSSPSGADEQTNPASKVTLTSVDTDEKSEDKPNEITAKIEGAKENDTAIITDQDGNVLARVPLTDNSSDQDAPIRVKKNDDGSFDVTFPIDENNPPSKVNVALQTDGQDPSTAVESDVLPVATGEKGHPNDKTPPSKPTISQTDDAVKVKFDPETKELTIDVPESGNDIVLKKQEDGSFKSDDGKYVVAKGEDTLTIPRADLPEAGGDLSATSTDFAGHTSSSVPTPVAPLKPQTEQPKITEVSAEDNSPTADNNPENFVIKGTAEPGATVIARDPNGNELGRSTADENGNYTINAKEKSDGDKPFDITDTNQISLVADKGDKTRESEPTYAPSVPTAEIKHTGDAQPPAQPTKGNNGNDTVFTITDKDNTASGKLTYTDKEGNKQTAAINKDPVTGELSTNDPNVQLGKDEKGNPTVTLPAANTKPNTEASLELSDLVPNSSKPVTAITRDPALVPSSDDTSAALEPSTQPTLTEVVEKDESNPADGTVDSLTVRGTATPNSTVDVKVGDVVVKNVPVKADGTFETTVKKPDNSPFAKGEKVTAIAQEAGKTPSQPAVEKVLTGQPTAFDDIQPNDPVTAARQPNGDIVASLPANAKVGEKATVSIDGKPAREVTFEKQPNGTWASSDPDVIPSTTAENPHKLTIPDAVTPADSTVSITTTDLANNTSKPTTVDAGRAESKPPVVDKVTAINTDSTADGTPEEVKITGTATPGAKVTVTDPTTNQVLGTGVADEKGNFEVIAKEPKDPTNPAKKLVDLVTDGKLTVSSQDPDEGSTAPNYSYGQKDPAEATTQPTIPAVEANKEGNPNVSTPDANVTKPNLSLDKDGNLVVELPKGKDNNNDGDTNDAGESVPAGTKVTVEFDEDNNPATPNTSLTITKKEEGWDIPAPAKQNSDGTVTIPKSELPTNGGTATATATDPNGVSTSTDSETIPATSATPTITSVTALDTTEEQADNNPEKLIIKGTSTEADGTDVIAYDSKGNVIGAGKVTNGEFTIETNENGHDITEKDTITVTAIAPNKAESAKTPAQSVPAVEAGKAGHIGDRTPPAKVTTTDEDNAVPADQPVTLTLPKDAETAVVKVQEPGKADLTDVVLTKKPDGGYSSSRPDIIGDVEKPAGEAAPTATIKPNTLKPGSVVTATATDLAGNESAQSDPIAITTPASKQTDLDTAKVKQPTVTAEENLGVTISVPKEGADGTAKLIVSYLPEGAQASTPNKVVEISKVNGTWTVPADSGITGPVEKDGNFVFTLLNNKVQDGSLVSAHTTSENGALTSPSATAKAPLEQTTAQPTEVTVTPVDTDPVANDTPEAVRFSGKAEPNALVEIKDQAGNSVATTRADKDGNFSVDVPANKAVGDTTAGALTPENIKVTAEAPNKKPSQAAETPVKQPLVHAGDEAGPAATTPVVNKDGANAGSVSATLPDDATEATITVGDEAIKLVKDGNEWKKAPATADGQPTALTPADGVSASGNTITVSKEKVQEKAATPAGQADTAPKEATVTVETKDSAGKSSPAKSETVVLLQPPALTIDKARDTSAQNDDNPEEFDVTVTAAPNTHVVITDNSGNKLGEGTTDANGTLKLTVTEAAGTDLHLGDNLKVIADGIQGKDSDNVVASEATTVKIPENLAVEHEETIPPAVTDVTRNPAGDTVTAKVDGDAKKIIAKVGDETVTLVKQNDNTFAPENGSTNNAGVTVTGPGADGKFTVTAPNAGGKNVAISAADNLGNTSIPVENRPSDAQPTEAATDPSLIKGNVEVKQAIDTSGKSDDNPERFEISGKTEPNATVEIKDKAGNTLATVTADENGNFTAMVNEATGTDMQEGDKFTIVATSADGSKTSGDVLSETIPPVTSHTDNTGPTGTTIERKPDTPATDGTPAKTGDVEINVAEDTNKALVKVGDETATLTRDKETGALISDKPELVPSTTAENPNTITVPGENAKDKDVSVTPFDELNNQGATATSSTAPAAPTLSGVESGVTDGSAQLGFPTENVRNGDQVVLTYQPVPTADNPTPARETMSFTKVDGGWDSNGDGTADIADGAMYTLPANKVEDESEVTAYSVSADGKYRSPVVDNVHTGIDGDGKTNDNGQPLTPAELVTAKPSELKLVATDSNNDGNPESFTLTGKVAGAAANTPVTITVGEGDNAKQFVGKTNEDGTFSITFTEPEGTDINVGTVLTVTAKEAGKQAASTTETVDKGEVVSTPNTTPPTHTLATTEDGVKVTLDPNAKEGDTATVVTTPAQVGDTAGQPSGTPETDKYVFKEGKWQPQDGDNNAPPVNAKGEVEFVLPPGSTATVTGGAAAGGATTDAGTATVPPRDTNGDGVADPVPVAPMPQPTATAQPNVTVEKATDTNPQADGNPEEFVLSGNIPNETEGTVVHLVATDSAGNILFDDDVTLGKDGTFSVTVTESPNKDLVVPPKGTPATESISVTAKAAGKTLSPVAEASLSDRVPVEFADGTPPKAPEVTANSTNGSVKVSLPDDAVVGDKVIVTFTPESPANAPETSATLTKNADGSWTSDNPLLVPSALDGATHIVIPENSLKDGSQVSAISQDVAGNKSTENGKPASSVTAGKDSATATPVINTVSAIDLDQTANSTPEKAVITGNVPAEGAGAVVTLTDETGKVIATTTTDANGDFSFTLVEKPHSATGNEVSVDAINVGDKYRVTAQGKNADGTDKQVSEVPASATLGDVLTGTAVHPNDAAAPTAPTITPSDLKGDGSVAVGLPADAVAGDKVIVSYTPEQPADAAEVSVTATKQPDGSWSLDPADSGLQLSGNNLVIPEDKVKDGSEVKAKSVDLAGKETPATGTAEEHKAGKDEAATQPQVEANSVRAIDLTQAGKPADSNPEKVTMNVKGKPGETVEAYVGEGDDQVKVGEVTIPAKAAVDANGLATAQLELNEPTGKDLLKEGTEVSLVAKVDGKDDSTVATVTIPAVKSGSPIGEVTDSNGSTSSDKGDHQPANPADTAAVDNIAPAKPTFAKDKPNGDGSVTLNLPTDAVEGDRVVVTFTPETPKGAPETSATLTKNADGSWTSDNPLIPNVAKDSNSVTIPENNLKDNSPVSAVAIDLAGNQSPKDSVTTKYDEVTTPVFDVTVQAVDTDNPANSSIEAIVVKGKTDPNAEVVIALPDGQTARATADASGNFVAIIRKDGSNTTPTDEALKQKLGLESNNNVVISTVPDTSGNIFKQNAPLTLTATAPEKDSSVEKAATVPALNNGTADHPFDTTKPGVDANGQPVAAEKPTVTPVTEAANGKNKGDVEVKFPSSAQPGDTLTVEAFPTDDPKTTDVDESKTPVEVPYVKQENGDWKVPEDKKADAEKLGIPDSVNKLKDAFEGIVIPAPKIADGTPVTAVLEDPAGNRSEPASGKVPYEAVTKLENVKLISRNGDNDTTPTDPETLTITADTDPGATVTVELTKADGSKVTLTKQADEKGKVEITFKEGEFPLTGNNDIVVGKGVKVTAELVGQKAPKEADPQTVPNTRTVFLDEVTVKSIDLGTKQGDSYNSNISDNTIDKIKVSGKIEKDAQLLVEVYNGATKVAAKTVAVSALGYTGETDGKNSSGDAIKVGTFSVELDAKNLVDNGSYQPNYSVKLTATNTDNSTPKADAHSDSNTIPTLNDGGQANGDHPSDKDATALTNDAIAYSYGTTGDDAGKVRATVTLPTEADVKTISLAFKDDSGNNQTATFTKSANGGWTASPEAKALGFSDIPAGTTTVEVPHGKLNGTAADRGDLTVTVTDIAGNSETISKAIPADRTAYVKVVGIAAQDTATTSDNGADQVSAVVEAAVGSTVKVTIRNAQGQEIGLMSKLVGENDGEAVADTANKDPENAAIRKVTITIPKGANNFSDKDNVTVEVTKSGQGKASQDQELGAIPSNFNDDGSAKEAGLKGHPQDNTAPTVPNTNTDKAVTLSYDNNGKAVATVKLPTDADTKTATIKFKKEGETAEQEVTLTKGANGWEAPADAKGLDVTKLANGEVTIPANVLDGAAGNKVKVSATDIAGNKSNEVSFDAADLPASTKTATNVTATSVDTSEVADSNPEKVTIAGDVTGAPDGTKVKLFTADGQPLLNADTNQQIEAEVKNGKFSVILTEKNPAEQGAIRVSEIPTSGNSTNGDYKVGVIEPNTTVGQLSPVDVTDVARGTKGDDKHTGDSTAPTVTADKTGSAVEFKLSSTGTKAGDVISIYDENTPNDTTGNDNVTAGNILAKFAFDGTKWVEVAKDSTPTGTTGFTQATQKSGIAAPVERPKAGGTNGEKEWVFTVPTHVAADNTTQPAKPEKGLNGISVGDWIKAKVEDYAGNNSGVAKAQAPDPTHIDPVTIKLGSTTQDPTADSKDPHKDDRVKVNSDPNAGDVFIKPGDDNTRIEISFTKPGETEATVIYGKKGDKGQWSFTTEKDGGTAVGEDIIKNVTASDNTPYIKLAANKVSDQSNVNVVVEDKDGNRDDSSVQADFDDSSDSTATAPAVTQADANSDINIGFTNNNPDVRAYIVEFTAPDSFTEETAANYGMSQGKNYLYVVKGSDNKWSASVVAANKPTNNTNTDDDVEFNFENIEKAASQSSKQIVKSIDEHGNLVLSKEYVKGSSAVNVKAVDAYGNSAESSLAGNTKHSEPVELPVKTPDQPRITRNHNDVEVSATPADLEELAKNSGAKYITTVKHNGKQFDIVYDKGNSESNPPVSPSYKLKQHGSETEITLTDGKNSEFGIKAFDATAGKVTLELPLSAENNGKKVEAQASKEVKGTTYTSDWAESTFNITLPENDPHVDNASVAALEDGRMEFTPGADNTEMKVNYNGKEVTLTKQGDNWTSSDNNFSSQNGKVYLAADAVNDHTKVTVKGKDQYGHEQTDPSEAWSKVPLGNDVNTADQPIITAQGKAGDVLKIKPGADNKALKVTFEKVDAVDNNTLMAELQNGGSWKLVDGTGKPVPDYVATIDASTGEISLKAAAVKPGNEKVTAIGIDERNQNSTEAKGNILAPVRPGEDINNDYYTLSSISDNKFEVTPTAKAFSGDGIQRSYMVSFKVYDNETNTIKTAYVIPNAPATTNGTQASYSTTTEFNRGSNGGTVIVEDSNGNKTIVEPNTADESFATIENAANGNKLVVQSSKRYKLIADSVADDLNSKAHDNLKVSVSSMAGEMNDLGSMGPDAILTKAKNAGMTARFEGYLKNDTSAPNKVEDKEFILESHNDESFTVTPTRSGQMYSLKFKFINQGTTGSQLERIMILTVDPTNSNSANKITAVYKQYGEFSMSSREYVTTSLKLPDGFVTLDGDKVTVNKATFPASSGGWAGTTYRLFADSNDGDQYVSAIKQAYGEGNHSENPLRLSAAYGDKTAFNNKLDGDANILLLNTKRGQSEVEKPPVDSGESAAQPTLPTQKAPQVELEAPTSGAQKGAMIIKPTQDQNRLEVSYTTEAGEKRTAILEKQGGNWVVTSGSTAAGALPTDTIRQDFDTSSGNPTLKASAVHDKDPANAGKYNVSVTAYKDGFKPSDPKELEAEANPSDLTTGADSTVSSRLENPDVSQDSHIYYAGERWIEWRRWENINPFVEKVRKTTGGSYTDARGDNDVPEMEFNFTNPNGTEIKVGKSLNYQWDNGFSKGRAMELNFENGSDLLMVGEDIGSPNRVLPYTRLNFKGGDNTLLVGLSQSTNRVMENPNAETTKERYKFVDLRYPATKKAAEAEGFTKEITPPHNHSGGRLVYTQVNAEEGDDVVLVGGATVATGIAYAIEGSSIRLGGGNDTLMVGDALRAELFRNTYRQNSIGAGTTIDMGDGNDYVKAAAIEDGSVLRMGTGNDEAEFTRMYGGNTKVLMGEGDDKVIITGEVRDNAEINLGSGDDTFVFKPTLHPNDAWSSGDKSALFEGKLVGGDGWDTVVLASPTGRSIQALVGGEETNFSARNFSGIEEVKIQNGSVLDIAYGDLLGNGHWSRDAEGIFGALIVSKDDSGSGSNVPRVDLGRYQLNNTQQTGNLADYTGSSGPSGVNGGTWEKGETKTLNGKQYDQYFFHYNDSANTADKLNAVWIEQGITII